MVLKELLQTIPNSTIKVGANASFVYCGANDYVANAVLQNLLEREVLYCEDSIAYFEPNTKIIKVVGEENGRYWTVEEFNKKLKKIKAKLNLQ